MAWLIDNFPCIIFRNLLVNFLHVIIFVIMRINFITGSNFLCGELWVVDNLICKLPWTCGKEFLHYSNESWLKKSPLSYWNNFKMKFKFIPDTWMCWIRLCAEKSYEIITQRKDLRNYSYRVIQLHAIWSQWTLEGFYFCSCWYLDNSKMYLDTWYIHHEPLETTYLYEWEMLIFAKRNYIGPCAL